MSISPQKLLSISLNFWYVLARNRVLADTDAGSIVPNGGDQRNANIDFSSLWVESLSSENGTDDS